MNNISILPVKDTRMLDQAYQSGGQRYVAYDAQTAGGLAFLNGELEKIDPKLREPLTSVTWQRDIVSKTGGGWVESTSTHNVSYGTTGANEYGIIGGQTNDIPVMQADIGKDIFKVFTWGHILKVPLVDQQKLSQIGRNLESILDSGLRLNYQKTLDQNVYRGFETYGTTGLLNDINVPTVMADEPFEDMTPVEILNTINQALTDTWDAAEYDLSGMPNHILIPPKHYTFLVNRIVSEAGSISVLKYLEENNIARNQGVDLTILPSRWCIGAGVGGADRMLLYVNDEDKVHFDITVPIKRVMTQPSVENMAYLSAYASQIGQVKFLYYQPTRYVDGI